MIRSRHLLKGKLAYDKYKHIQDIAYEQIRNRIDMGGFKPVSINEHVFEKKEQQFYDILKVRHGLFVFDSYFEALRFVMHTNGPSSFFIKGYRWPWHSKRDYVGVLFPTAAQPRLTEKKAL